MLESNVFRLLMSVLGVIVFAMMIAMFFTMPAVTMTPQQKSTYEDVMNVRLADQHNTLTAYQAFWFMIESHSRSASQYN